MKANSDTHVSTGSELETLLSVALMKSTLDVSDTKMPEVIAYTKQHRVLDTRTISQLWALRSENLWRYREPKRHSLPSTFVHDAFFIFYSQLFKKVDTGIISLEET